ncbi:MAG: helix-hairpin-helix domain-containing protein [Emergencia sp.]
MDKFNMENLKAAVNAVIDRSKRDKRIWIAAASAVVLIVAVLFFGNYGKNEKLVITSPEDETLQVADSQDTAVSAKIIYVDISGEVKNQGVYQVADGTRLFEVIEKAGGLTANASIESINQAEVVTDGQKIIVPNKDDFVTSGSGQNQGSKGLMDNGLVNINIADLDGLQEIPGVGPATAEKIIAYRNSNGSFKSKEDLMNVSGIGQKTFDKIKDMITV